MRENEAPSKRRLRGVEVREQAHGGEHRYAYRVRYLNAQGQRKARTFDTPQDAMGTSGQAAAAGGRRGDPGAHAGQPPPRAHRRDARERPRLRRAAPKRPSPSNGAIGARPTLVIEQRCVDGKILPGQKTTRPPRSIPLLSVLRADLREHQLACGRSEGLIFQRAGEKPWRTSDWRAWRVSAWQPACEAIGLATITHTTNVLAGKPRRRATVAAPFPTTCGTASRACLSTKASTHSYRSPNGSATAH